ncbi:MAG: UDP-N-acetylglucosamine 1-carboxyvinyltransferase [Verrucomicrobiales bacterium]
METLLVHGGSQLGGTISISGSKNSSLPILAATLLTRDTCTIRRVPDLSDTNYMLQILGLLGADVERASGNVEIKAESIHSIAPYDLVRKMRASVCVLGPLVGRLGEANVSMPGGCVIGDRPIDLHLKGFEALGAEVEVVGGDVLIKANGTLQGNQVNMRGKSGTTVLGTDNILMAAVLANGTTVIEGAAAEPEVVDLANFLNKMGAKIEGAGTPRIEITGVSELHGAEHTVIPDRIEAGTFLVAGAIAGRDVKLTRVNAEHLKPVIEALRISGHEIDDSAGDSITVSRGSAPMGHKIVTEPHPGFPTDMQAQMCALYATTPGMSVVTETVFPSRFMHVAELNRMGADIHMDDATAMITGVEQLSGAQVMASDLRASAALVLAGLTAEGQTEIHRLYHIDRGYEHIDEKLTALGAKLERRKERV